MEDLPKPMDGAVFYEDAKLYACLANNPKSKGHCVVVWKKRVRDIHSLSRKNFLHLMDITEKVHNVLMKVTKTTKVYMMYLDEIKHIHWHLIPRYKIAGYTLLKEKPKQLQEKDLKLASKLYKELKKK
ncbi:hypothetical protein CL619_02035 [archaeon]|nr:hypothetical protein [archaeon]|tara:strand:- start:1038 stop:1421 length:384 start_codon:yes stop_codon:yes gene_type:complete